MASWERKRQPDDVPTPIAVAVSDFCRRAGAPASPREVREALSTVTDGDEFRIRAVTDAEPPLRPLGPFAVVDLARGTAVELAGLRQRAGYYTLVEELLGPRTATTPAPPTEVADPPAPMSASPTAARAPDAQRGTDAPASPVVRQTPRATVAERIAPRRRAPAPPTTPRGRYTQVAAERAPLETLGGPAGRDVLEPLLLQHAHRIALTRALAMGYVGKRGGDPLPHEVDEVLAAHGLTEGAEARERELVLGALSEHRGALGRVGWALGLRPAELRALIGQLGLDAEVERTRERFRHEALAPAYWTIRLDLLGRRKYLEDLGLQQAFEERLRTDLTSELARPDVDGPDRVDRLARRLGVPPELLVRTLSRLGLIPERGAPSSPP